MTLCAHCTNLVDESQTMPTDDGELCCPSCSGEDPSDSTDDSDNSWRHVLLWIVCGLAVLRLVLRLAS